jgi:hypothetical protein
MDWLALAKGALALAQQGYALYQQTRANLSEDDRAKLDAEWKQTLGDLDAQRPGVDQALKDAESRG